MTNHETTVLLVKCLVGTFVFFAVICLIVGGPAALLDPLGGALFASAVVFPFKALLERGDDD